MNLLPGTQIYKEFADYYIQSYESVEFRDIHSSILDLLMDKSSVILDLGSGSGRDAAALAKMGHNVTAVEPVTEFLNFAKEVHISDRINWVQDSLPELSYLFKLNDEFDFILCHGVWQHLEQSSRFSSLRRVSDLLGDQGLFALTLRHGPMGKGHYHLETDTGLTVNDAAGFGLKLIRKLENQVSLIAGKADVTWTRLVFEKNVK